MKNLQSREKMARRPIRNLLRKAAPLVAAISISACAPVKPPKAKPSPVKIVKKDPTEAPVKALGHPDQKHMIPDLVNQLGTDDPVRREVAKFLLMDIGMAALPELISRIQMSSCGCHGMTEADLIVDIIRENNKDPRAKKAARSVLGFLFSAYAIATPLGLHCIAGTINKMDKKTVVDYAREVLNENKSGKHLLSVIILGNHGSKVDLPALRKIAKNDPVELVRENAKEAIGKILAK